MAVSFFELEFRIIESYISKNIEKILRTDMKVLEENTKRFLGLCSGLNYLIGVCETLNIYLDYATCQECIWQS